MTKMTITEGLAEINLLKKKIEANRSTILNNIVRAKHVPDSFTAQGGSFKYNAQQLQSIKDMNERLVKIRSAIALANMQNAITIGQQTKTIHDWLTWRREVLPDETKMIAGITQKIRQHLEQVKNQPQVYKDQEGKTHLVEWDLNIDHGDILAKSDALTEIEEKLDGQLSLKNATTVIEI